jgi:membrane-associated phospholipid phosphatase
MRGTRIRRIGDNPSLQASYEKPSLRGDRLYTRLVDAAGVLRIGCERSVLSVRNGKRATIRCKPVHFDRTLGFDWPSVYHWVHAHVAVQRVLAFAYDSGIWQLPGIPLVLGLLGRNDDLSDFVLHLMLSIILIFLVSTPFPVASAFLHFNIADPNTVATVSDFNLLRTGMLRHFDLTRMQGLVSFPSFHTALAIFFAHSLRRNGVLFPFAVLLNVTMIISTPTQGGHYLADVVGGLILALVTIKALKFMSGRGRSQPDAFFDECGRPLKLKCEANEMSSPQHAMPRLVGSSASNWNEDEHES